MTRAQSEYINYVANLIIERTMESRLIWTLPEADIFREEFEAHRTYDRSSPFKREQRRKRKLWRERLRKLDYRNARQFQTQIRVPNDIPPGDYYQKDLKVLVTVSETLIVMEIEWATSEWTSYKEKSNFTSDDFSQLITLSFLLRNPKNIRHHLESKYVTNN